MDEQLVEQILEELIPTFEALQTQSTAILHFLKDKGIAQDEELAPYLEQAAGASSVRWRAVALRMKRLLSLAEKASDKKREERAATPVEDKNSAKAKSKPEKPETERAIPSKEPPGKDAAAKQAGAPEASKREPELTKASGGGTKQTNRERHDGDAA